MNLIAVLFMMVFQLTGIAIGSFLVGFFGYLGYRLAKRITG